MIGIAWLANEVIIAKHVYVPHVGFCANLFEYGAWEYFTSKDCLDVFGFYLVDQIADFLWSWLVKRRGLQCPNNGVAVMFSEVGVRIVVRHEFAL